MVITKEHQEAMLQRYAKNHGTEECLGYVDGMNAILELMNKNKLYSFPAFDNTVKPRIGRENENI